MRVGTGLVGASGDVAFDAADVGHDGARGQARGDFLGHGHDAIHWRCQHDQSRRAHGFLNGVGGGVAPRLRAELDACIWTARPDDDAFGQAACACGAGDGASEQAWSEDGELFQHGLEPRKNRQRCRAVPLAGLGG